MSVPSPSDVPTPAGGSAPLSTSPAAARSSQPEFDIPYDFVSELPKSVGQQRWEAFVNKNKQNPFIGLGCLATIGALVGAVRSMRAGNQRQMQLFFRARVAAQAFAVVAIVVGGVMYEGAHPIKSLMNIPDNARLGFERNEAKRDALTAAMADPTSAAAAEVAATAPPTLTPKRSFQDHAVEEAQKKAGLTPEERMRATMLQKGEEAEASREDRRNKYKLN